ncbi:MAG: hypothetical protein IJA27_04945 [Lachnospiraceae bacterium]|nr:hypothetical protein [Lachnospiraceae bacterium]
MAKKKKNVDNENINDILGDSSILENEPHEGNKAVSAIITILIIVIWLGIFVALIKFDVMGFGSNVMAPILKDVPVLNKILPDSALEEENEDIPYKSIAECAAYIKELESELAEYQQAENDKDAQIAELQAEVARLKQFEDNQTAFEQLKAEFYEEVVFGTNAPDVENYVKYYQEIDKENADLLYLRAIEKYAYDQEVIERAKYYSSMKPANAAKIFCEMTGDLDIVVALLNSMDAEDSGAIIAAISDIDSVFAAKVTKKLMP